jgi:pilus assembly protein CpaB
MTLEEIVGRRVRSKIWLGEPLLEAKLLQKGESAENPASLIPKGLRVVSVRVDAVSSSGNLIKPGDRVDVIVHLQQNSGRSISETTSKTFLQDVKVFAVNDIVSRDPGDGETRISAQTISLLVKPSDVELVTLASEMGRIRLSMRGPSDDKPVDTMGVVANELLGNVGESNREEDEPRPDIASPANDLLGMLNQQPKIEVAAVEPEKPKHTMTLLLGARVEEIELEEGSMISRSKGSSTVLAPATPAATEAIVNPPVTESPDTVTPDETSPDAVSAEGNKH